MNQRLGRRSIVFAWTLWVSAAGVVSAGELTPPAGPVAPTPGPEPRIAINEANTPGHSGATFVITQPGSYFLTGNVTGESGKYGILIQPSRVTVDLNGFAMIGVTGSLDGIAAFPGVKDIVVRNGSVASWGRSGVDLANAVNGAVEGVVASDNEQIGLRSGSNFIISRCAASGNGVATGQNGIHANGHAVIEHCTAVGNGGSGIGGGSLGSVVWGCAARDNGAFGVTVGDRCLIADCAAFSNENDGIHAGGGCTINGCTSSGNSRDGIEAAGSCLITGNVCAANGAGAVDGAGIHVTGPDSRIEGNNVSGGDRGMDVDVSGNIIIRNSVSGATTNWDIATGNKCLVVNGVNAGAISGTSGGVSIGSTDPWANFTY
jgi:hypothetical protein